MFWAQPILRTPCLKKKKNTHIKSCNFNHITDNIRSVWWNNPVMCVMKYPPISITHRHTHWSRMLGTDLKGWPTVLWSAIQRGTCQRCTSKVPAVPAWQARRKKHVRPLYGSDFCFQAESLVFLNFVFLSPWKSPLFFLVSTMKQYFFHFIFFLKEKLWRNAVLKSQGGRERQISDLYIHLIKLFPRLRVWDIKMNRRRNLQVIQSFVHCSGDRSVKIKAVLSNIFLQTPWKDVKEVPLVRREKKMFGTSFIKHHGNLLINKCTSDVS